MIRISREYMPDDMLARASRALTAYSSMLGAMQHRYEREDDTPAEAIDELRQDGNAISAVLGILLAEERERKTDDRELQDDPHSVNQS